MVLNESTCVWLANRRSSLKSKRFASKQFTTRKQEEYQDTEEGVVRRNEQQKWAHSLRRLKVEWQQELWPNQNLQKELGIFTRNHDVDQVQKYMRFCFEFLSNLRICWFEMTFDLSPKIPVRDSTVSTFWLLNNQSLHMSCTLYDISDCPFRRNHILSPPMREHALLQILHQRLNVSFYVGH